nr:uncharacterized protein LOC104088126 [Nicotiana tomentosiformis]
MAAAPARGRGFPRVALVVLPVDPMEDHVIEEQDEAPAAELTLVDFMTAPGFQEVTMDREVGMGTSYEQVVEIARRIEGIRQQARHMVEKVCLAYLEYVRDTTMKAPMIDSVPVVQEFFDVFPSDLPGMPPDCDIDFSIYLVPGTQPISIPLYHMASKKLKELKEQLEELLTKGFIMPSVSP